MVSSAPNILVDTTIARLGLWLKSLESEFAEAIVAHELLGESGAVRFVKLLQAVLERYRRAYDRYQQQTAAPANQRLQWLQRVGAGLADLEGLFGRLSVPVAPTLTPMLAAFSRLLQSLVPQCRPIYRPVRDFNYEIEEFHSSSDFAPLLGASVRDHQWPMLFITLPTGILDSPRAHILVAHEIGHAVAASRREEVECRETEQREAVAAGTAPASSVPSLLPQPTPPRREVLQIARQRWLEQGLPVPQPPVGSQPSGEHAVLLEVVADVGAEVDDWVEAWIEELFSDALGTCLFGPAFFIAALDVLLATGSLDRSTPTHPSLAARLQCIGRTLQHAEIGLTPATLPANLRRRFETAMADAQTALTTLAPTTGSEARLVALVTRLVLGQVDDIVATAISHAKTGNVLYTAKQFEADIAQYVPAFVHAGVPPIARDVSLACVFNVGQVLSSDHIDEFCPGIEDSEKERRIDDLLLKAIELNEIATMWGEA